MEIMLISQYFRVLLNFKKLFGKKYIVFTLILNFSSFRNLGIRPKLSISIETRAKISRCEFINFHLYPILGCATKHKVTWGRNLENNVCSRGQKGFSEWAGSAPFSTNSHLNSFFQN